MPTIGTLQGQPLTEPVLPINSLTEFLEEVRGLFDNAVYHWDQLLFKRKFRMGIRDAWTELRIRFNEVIRNLGLPEFEEKLREAGLDGIQLTLKLDVLNDVWEQFKERGLVSLLLDVLEWIGIYLDSLAMVFPQIEGVKEFVDVVTSLISQNENLTGHKAAS
ncbi:MAG: hypothetical protein R2867_23380 [Caldilineaceae bacterium]